MALGTETYLFSLLIDSIYYSLPSLSDFYNYFYNKSVVHLNEENQEELLTPRNYLSKFSEFFNHKKKSGFSLWQPNETRYLENLQPQISLSEKVFGCEEFNLGSYILDLSGCGLLKRINRAAHLLCIAAVIVRHQVHYQFGEQGKSIYNYYYGINSSKDLLDFASVEKATKFAEAEAKELGLNFTERLIHSYNQKNILSLLKTERFENIVLDNFKKFHAYAAYVNSKIRSDRPTAYYLYTDQFLFENNVLTDKELIINRLREHDWNVLTANVHSPEGLCTAIKTFSKKVEPNSIIFHAHGATSGKISFDNQGIDLKQVHSSITPDCFSNIPKANKVGVLLLSCYSTSELILSGIKIFGKTQASGNLKDIFLSAMRNLNERSYIQGLTGSVGLLVLQDQRGKKVPAIFYEKGSDELEFRTGSRKALEAWDSILKYFSVEKSDYLHSNFLRSLYKRLFHPKKHYLIRQKCTDSLHGNDLEYFIENLSKRECIDVFMEDISMDRVWQKLGVDLKTGKPKTSSINHLDRWCVKKLHHLHPDRQKRKVALSSESFAGLVSACSKEISARLFQETLNKDRRHFNSTFSKMNV